MKAAVAAGVKTPRSPQAAGRQAPQAARGNKKFKKGAGAAGR
jgi:hypothetical protein